MVIILINNKNIPLRLVDFFSQIEAAEATTYNNQAFLQYP